MRPNRFHDQPSVARPQRGRWRRAVLVAASGALGLLLGIGIDVLRLDPWIVVGIGAGLGYAALAIRREAARLAGVLGDLDPSVWLDHLMGAERWLRRPVRAAARRTRALEQALADAVGRQQITELEFASIQGRLDVMEQASHRARAELASVTTVVRDALLRAGSDVAERLLDEIGIAARFRSGDHAAASIVAMGDLIAEIAVARPSARGRVVVAGNPPVVSGPADLLSSLIERVVDWAVERSEGSSVRVEGWSDRALAVLRVAVSGPVLPSHMWEDMFEFDWMRDPGLPTARIAAQTLGGDLWVERSGASGTVLAAAFPRTYAADAGQLAAFRRPEISGPEVWR